MKRLAFFLFLAAAAIAQSPVAPIPGQLFTASWTSSTTGGAIGTGAVVQIPSQGFNAVSVTLNQTTTIAAGAVTFEVSDTPDATVTNNWYTVLCTATDTGLQASTYTLQASTNKAFWCNLGAFRRFEVRLSTAITGSATVLVGVQLSSVGNIPPAAQPAAGGSTTVTNLPTTVDTGNGTTSASTLRVTTSSDSTGQIKATNFPTTVDTNQGAAGASTLRSAVSNLPTTVDTNTGNAGASTVREVIATNQPNLTTPLNVQVQSTPGTTGLISRTYLGFGSANTAKTTGNVSITASTTGHGMLAIGCSGNFATSNWTASVTDSASNAYSQIGALSGTYPQAQSTTQVCIAFYSPNVTSATTANFTIAGTNSATTTVTIMVWDVANAIPSLAAIDHWSYFANGGATAFATQPMPTSQANELAIAAGCASTGTVSLATNSALTFDSGNQAIASGVNCVTAFGGSVVIPSAGTGATGSFTDGSSALVSEVLVTLRGYSLTDSGLPKQFGTAVNESGLATFGNAPVSTAQPVGFIKANNAAANVTASQTIAGIQGKAIMVTAIGYCYTGDTTGNADSETISLITNSLTIWAATAGLPAGAGAVGSCQSIPFNVAVPDSNQQGWSLAFGGHSTHGIENVWIAAYYVDLPNIVF